MTAPIRPSEATLLEVRQALMRIEMNRRNAEPRLAALELGGTASALVDHAATHVSTNPKDDRLPVSANVLLGGVAGPLVEEIACTAAGRALIDDANAAAQRTTLGLVIGTNVEAYDAAIQAHLPLTTDPHSGDMTLSTRLMTSIVQSYAAVNVNLTLNAYSASFDTTVYVKNSHASKVADLDVENDIIVGGVVDGRDVAADGAVLDTAMQDLIDDTTPQLGGNLDVNGKSINAAFLLDTGSAKGNLDILTLSNDVNDADMDGTETSILFRQAYLTGTLVDAARITAGTEDDWTSTAGTRDGYLAFHTSLDGVVSEKMRITSGGRVGINITDPTALNAHNFLTVHREGSYCNFTVAVESNGVTEKPALLFARARGTEDTKLAVVSGDWIGAFTCMGYDGSNYKFPAAIEFKVDGAVSANTVPTSIAFGTGAPSRVVRLTIQSDGDMLVDTDSKMSFRQASLFIQSSAIGQLDINATTEVEITATTIDLTATNVYVRNVNGINYIPGSNIDVDLITVNVAGAPKFWWDDSEAEFATTHHLNIAGGWSGTFTNGDADTVTVKDGIITGVA